MKSILDRSFKYVPSHETDLRETFARIRHEQKIAEETRKALEQSAPEAWVRPLRKALMVDTSASSIYTPVNTGYDWGYADYTGLDTQDPLGLEAPYWERQWTAACEWALVLAACVVIVAALCGWNPNP